jgi:hypothetical protein
VTRRSPLANLLSLGFWVTLLALALTHHYRACSLLGAVAFAWSIVFALLRPTTLLPRVLTATALGLWGVECALFAAGIAITPVFIFVACWVGLMLLLVGANIDPTLKEKRKE